MFEQFAFDGGPVKEVTVAVVEFGFGVSELALLPADSGFVFRWLICRLFPPSCATRIERSLPSTDSSGV